jgi:two-component system alkaline phosphatase synthesis response regulator PhoP
LKKLLLVEDDQNLAEGLMLILKSKGYEVRHVSDGSRALAEIRNVPFDLVLLDIMLPLLDGISVCKTMRAESDTTPVLFITARDERENKLEGLLAGGDDYITKPFDTDELLARIHGIFRRISWLETERSNNSAYKFDGRTINFKTLEASGPSGKFRLSRKECMVVKYLVEQAGEAVSRDQLLDAIWGYQSFPTSRTVDNFILKIRKIFENDPKKPVYFETIRGIGYRFSSNKSKNQRRRN